MPSLSQKVVWITGASSGIGEALAYALAKKGTRLILSARRKEELDRVKGNCPASAQPDIRVLPLDLTEFSTLKLCTEAAIQLFGHVDILVNNGGISQRSLVNETTLDVDKRIMDVNYFGAVALTKYLLPHFINRQTGHYVTVSSVTGKFGTPYRSGYAASKHALHGFFDAVRAEHYSDNIKVTMICPGFIRTSIALSTITGDGSTLKKPVEGKYKGKPADWCAEKIAKAIEKQKQEVYIGGTEVLGVYIKRFIPNLFSRLIRSVAVR
jgi:short-subunit dehydrogenase